MNGGPGRIEESGIRWHAWFLGLGLLCLAIGTWRSFPVIDEVREARAPLRVVLFDLSAGTTRLRPAHGLWARGQLKRQAQEARAAGEELAVGIYGREVRRLGLEPAEDWLARLMGRGGEVLRLELDGDAAGASNLDGALALYEAELCDPARPRAQLILCGERDCTGADPRPRLARLAGAGVATTWIDPPGVRRPDFALEGLRLPRNPAPGEPLVAEFDLALAGARALEQGDFTLELFAQVERPTGLDEHRWTLSAPDLPLDRWGLLRWTVRQELGPAPEGRAALAARVLLRQGNGAGQENRSADPVPENDVRSAQTRSGDQRLVAAVGRAEDREHLLTWLAGGPGRWPGLQWRILTPSQLPEALGELDLLVSFDLGPGELPPALVEAFVRSGGGWFFCGGWGSLRGWFEDGFKASPLTQLLPLVPAPQGGRPRDVIFMVDGSGSMSGAPFERVRSALAGLVTSTSPEDVCSLRFFTGNLGPPLQLTVDAEGPLVVLRRLMDSRVPGGATSIYYSLERLLEEREALARGGRDQAGGGREALVFLLTDGKDLDSFDQATRGPMLRERFEAVGTRLVPIAIGAEADLDTLRHLNPPGEDVIDGNKELDLREVFLREVFEERVRTGDLAIVPGEPGRLAGTADLLAAWNSLGRGLPNLQRYLRCEERPDADVLMRGREGAEAVLAWKRVGSGRVAAWASAPLTGWGPAYLDGEAWLGPLLRNLAADPGAADGCQMEVVGNRLVLREVPADWPAEVELVVYAQIPGAGIEHFPSSHELDRVRLWVPESTPGTDPLRTRVGTLPTALVERARGAPVHGVCYDPRGGELLGQSGLDLPCPEEFRHLGRLRVEQEFQAAPDRRGLPPEPRPDPHAWIWLVVGASLVSLGAAWPGSPLRAGARVG